MLTRVGILVSVISALTLAGFGRRGPLEPPPGVVQEKPAKPAAAARPADKSAPAGLFRNTTDKTEDPGAPAVQEKKSRATGSFILDPLLQ